MSTTESSFAHSATIESSGMVLPASQAITAAQLEAIPVNFPETPYDYELDEGRLVAIMAPPGNMHSGSQGRLLIELVAQGSGSGLARVEIGVVLSRNPDTVFGADVAFIANKSLPVIEAPEGYLETIPELVAEVRSKNDTLAEMRRKAEKYIAAGVEVVWLVDPVKQTVTELRPGAATKIFQEADALALPGLIPDFRLTVAEIFAE